MAMENRVRARLSDEARKQVDDHAKLCQELRAIDEKYNGTPRPQNVGEEYETKLKEAERLQQEFTPEVERVKQEIDQLDRSTRQRQAADDTKNLLGRTIPTMPAPDDVEDEGKGFDDVAGYVSLADWIVLQKEYQAAAAAGTFRQILAFGEIPASMQITKGRNGRRGLDTPYIPLNRAERKVVDDLRRQSKTLTVLTNVVEDDRLDVVVASTADDRLRLRDIITMGSTTSDVVSYIRRTTNTRAAATTAAGSAKPEGALVWQQATANVYDIPAWVPVTTDQLADWPQMRMLIDNWLTYDVRRHEENQVLYGDGSSDIEGLFHVSGTNSISSSALYTAGNDILEKIRLGITLVFTSGYEANALLIHPLDWFSTVVLKGTDDHYLGQMFMTMDREPRVWGINVVETEACQEESGVATPQRNFLVGDFRRGCALIERMGVNISIGLNSDDFTKNRRTILAEERVAFPIYAPAAFAKLQTQAEAT